MKINAANAQETKDYMFMLPFGMEMMHDVAQAPLILIAARSAEKQCEHSVPTSL